MNEQHTTLAARRPRRRVQPMSPTRHRPERPTATSAEIQPASRSLELSLHYPAPQEFINAAAIRLRQILTPLLGRPRRVQLVAAVLGTAYVLWSVWHVGTDAASGAVSPTVATQVASESMPAISVRHSMASPLDLISAYNAASITVGETGQAAVMQPFLTSDGAAWQAVQHEFARRAARAEIHRPRLVRWGVVEQSATATEATVETQEVWDDETLVAGVLVDARRGLIQRVRYHLLRPDSTQPWLIDTIDSQIILP